jgi:hypothetical protein
MRNLTKDKQKIKKRFFFVFLFVFLFFNFSPLNLTKNHSNGSANSALRNLSTQIKINSAYGIEINYPRLPGAIPPQKFTNNTSIPPEKILSLYIKYIFVLVIWIGGLIAFGFLIYGGVLYLISSGNPNAVNSAREQMIAAFFGLLVLLSSYLILYTINPQIISNKPLTLKPPQGIERPNIPSPEINPLNSSIDVELPLGRIIEGRIFETYVPPDSDKIPRMTRIKNNAGASAEIADSLAQKSEHLKDLTSDCSCGRTSCSPIGCNCDPCSRVRLAIERTEKENNELIEKMKAKQKTTRKEIKELKIELEKLKRLARYFTQDCRLWTLKSLKEYLIKANNFQGELRMIRFWSDIDTVYYQPKQEEGKEKAEQVRDWATFYCPIGGTTFAKQPPTPPLKEPTPKLPPQYTAPVESCPREAPIGEIIDRSERTAGLLIKKMEVLHNLQGEIISNIDNLHVLISQCSSWNCSCIPFHKKCVGSPCPYQDIYAQTNKIKEIKDAIDKLANHQANEENSQKNKQEENKEEMGIIPIIDKIVPKLLTDFRQNIRFPMKECVVEGGNKVLFDCQRTIGALDPQGDVIRTCCNTEPVFNECLNQCYLEEGQKNYRKCLTECLNEKTKEKELEDIAWCRHQLNFYCCNIKQEGLK